MSELAQPQLSLLFPPPPARNVARNLRGTNDPAVAVADGRHGKRYFYQRPVLAPTQRIVVVDTFAAADALQDHRHLVLAARGSQHSNMLADDLLGGIAEEALGSRVPAGYDTIKVLAGDRVITALDDGGQESSFQASWNGQTNTAGRLVTNVSLPGCRAGAANSHSVHSRSEGTFVLLDPIRNPTALLIGGKIHPLPHEVAPIFGGPSRTPVQKISRQGRRCHQARVAPGRLIGRQPRRRASACSSGRPSSGLILSGPVTTR